MTIDVSYCFHTHILFKISYYMLSLTAIKFVLVQRAIKVAVTSIRYRDAPLAPEAVKLVDSAYTWKKD